MSVGKRRKRLQGRLSRLAKEARTEPASDAHEQRFADLRRSLQATKNKAQKQGVRSRDKRQAALLQSREAFEACLLYTSPSPRDA